MGIGTSIFLIAVGAVLKYAVDATVSGLNIHTIGVILMIVGVIGLAVTLLILNGGAGGWYGGARRTTVVDEGYVDPDPALVSRRRVVRRRDVL
jgi:hypothetical protein